STKRNRPVSTSMLTRMLVPKPKKAFQSPGVHKIGRKPVVDVVVVIARSLAGGSGRKWRRAVIACSRDRIEQRLRCGNRTENAALRLDHGEAGLVEFREIGGATVRQHDASEAAVVSLAHRGVDADFRGDA